MDGDSPIVNSIDEEANTRLVESTLFRLTQGLPKRELRLMVQEANECETQLLEDIRILEKSLEGGGVAKNEDCNSETTLSIILESPLTPLDRYWTASALLGRLRQEIALPSLLSAKCTSNANKNNKASAAPQSAVNDEKLNWELTTLTIPLAKAYSREIIPVTTLLAVWKKISSNRAASVFKRPVRSEEAPGYTERILFPMDLSLIRKRIVANNIQTYSDLHAALGLISHNCVKYNGRETDYGRVARDFEAMADNAILLAVQQAAANPQAMTEAITAEQNDAASIAPSASTTITDTPAR